MKTTFLARAWALLWTLALTTLLPRIGAADADLIVDGAVQSVEGGTFRQVIVKNAGVLTTLKALQAQAIYVLGGTFAALSAVASPVIVINGGTCSISGRMDVGSLSLPFGMLDALGGTNDVQSIELGGTLLAHGIWNIQKLRIASNAVLRVTLINTNKPLSGTLSIFAKTVEVESGGSIDGNASGNDPRGRGLDWYASATGGSAFGHGGRGYWGSSDDGKRSPFFGTAFAYEAFMGGAGGGVYRIAAYGGAAILIEATELVHISGQISANGQNAEGGGEGGGAGGSVIVRSPIVQLEGQLSARGGNGNDGGGGGSGGGVKLFNGNEDLTLQQLEAHAAVSGGKKGQGLNTENGEDGVIYQDTIPKVSLGSPVDGFHSDDGNIQFAFQLIDFGPDTFLSPRIELSTDGFDTIMEAFDSNETTTGWNKIAYQDGDNVLFQPPTPLAPGVYAWRVAVRDQSIYSVPTVPRILSVKSTTAPGSLQIGIQLVPALRINATIGTRVGIEYKEDLAEPSWQTATILSITNRPQLYYDESANSSHRLYRLAAPIP